MRTDRRVQGVRVSGGERRATQGGLVPIPELRARVPLEREAFDEHVLQLHAERLVHLLSHVDGDKLSEAVRQDCHRPFRRGAALLDSLAVTPPSRGTVRQFEAHAAAGLKWSASMSDLKSELASLRIDRDRPARTARRWPLLLLLPALVLLAVLYAMRAGGSRGGLEVEAAQATLVPGGTSGGGAAILTASGYVVARRKAVVSAKIQGRLADLRVEEGDRVREGELIARLESNDDEAQVQRAQALLQRAEADLAENERLLRQANDLAAQQIFSRDQVDVAESRVRIAQAAMAQARAEIGYAQAQMQNTRILAPFTGTVVKKMAEVGESVAPIPPGVNLSTSSGAIVALADLDTLEVEADVSESNVGEAQGRAAGRGHGRRLPGPP